MPSWDFVRIIAIKNKKIFIFAGNRVKDMNNMKT